MRPVPRSARRRRSPTTVWRAAAPAVRVGTPSAILFRMAGGDQAPRRADFVPALGRLGTRFYDPLIRVTTRERRFKERLLDLAELQPGERVLDLGCGTGTLAVAVGLPQPRARLTGLDVDPSMLQRAGAGRPLPA